MRTQTRRNARDKWERVAEKSTKIANRMVNMDEEYEDRVDMSNEDEDDADMSVRDEDEEAA